jgi:hypothetical protein
MTEIMDKKARAAKKKLLMEEMMKLKTQPKNLKNQNTCRNSQSRHL